MATTRLGRTGLMVGRTAFGALPIQRIDGEEARAILRRAYEAGVNFYDTARGYTDSEEKLGYALSDVRDGVVIATKSPAGERAKVLEHVEASLGKLKTDYVDVLQLHNPSPLPDPDNPESAYAGLVQARQEGEARFVGISNHRLDLALEAAESGLYDTVQFPLSAISSEQDLRLVKVCKARDVGLVAMKPLCGGLLTDVAAAFAFLRPFENVVPIWGIQRREELEEILTLDANPPVLNRATRERIEKDRAELKDDFCRACGYCLPCPAGIPIPNAARIVYLMRRMPSASFLAPEWQGKMRRIEDCEGCGQCAERCPYGLDPPTLLRKMYSDCQRIIAAGGVSV